MWIQENTNKPLWFRIKDKTKADLIIRQGSFSFSGKTYTCIGYGDKNAYSELIRVFYPVNNWEHYDKLKYSVKMFKKTGIWEI